MTPDPKGEYDAPLYGDPDPRECLRILVVLAGIFMGFAMGVLVGRLP